MMMMTPGPVTAGRERIVLKRESYEKANHSRSTVGLDMGHKRGAQQLQPSREGCYRGEIDLISTVGSHCCQLKKTSRCLSRGVGSLVLKVALVERR